MSKYIVELESGVWIALWGVTLKRENAKKYKSISSATYALALQRKEHDFINAAIYKTEALYV